MLGFSPSLFFEGSPVPGCVQLFSGRERGRGKETEWDVVGEEGRVVTEGSSSEQWVNSRAPIGERAVGRAVCGGRSGERAQWEGAVGRGGEGKGER